MLGRSLGFQLFGNAADERDAPALLVCLRHLVAVLLDLVDDLSPVHVLRVYVLGLGDGAQGVHVVGVRRMVKRLAPPVNVVGLDRHVVDRRARAVAERAVQGVRQRIGRNDRSALRDDLRVTCDIADDVAVVGAEGTLVQISGGAQDI